jgi:transcription elongation GreA/GreB family factor
MYLDVNGHGGGGSGGRRIGSLPPIRRPEVGAVGIGCEVVIRSVRAAGEREVELPKELQGEPGDHVITIVGAEGMGPQRVTTRTPLGRALLGHRVGDVVTVRTQARTLAYEVLAIEVPRLTVGTEAGLAEQVDAAVLKIAPVKGPGSSPGAGTTLDTDLVNGEADALHSRFVQLGDVVDVRDGELEESWRVVPHPEADATRRWISDESPLGRALLGRRAGEVVSVRPPAVHGVLRPAWPVTILAVKSVQLPA